MDNKNNEVIIPKSHLIFAGVVHWVTIVSCVIALISPVFILLFPQNNVLNPNLVYGAIFSGASPAEIWKMSATGSFPGAHFYLTNLFTGDGFSHFGVALGCSVGLWALLPAMYVMLKREKDYLYFAICSMLVILILLAMTGVLNVQTG